MKSEKNEKKPYATPKLTVHGNVEKITRGLQAGQADLAQQGSGLPTDR